MNYTTPAYGPGLNTNIPGKLYDKIETDKKLTRKNISPYKRKICSLNQPVGIKFANKSDRNYYALFLIQQQLFGQSNSAILAGQDTGGQLQSEKVVVDLYRSNKPFTLCQSTLL